MSGDSSHQYAKREELDVDIHKRNFQWTCTIDKMLEAFVILLIDGEEIEQV